MGIPMPEEYGGAGADTISYAIAIEELTRIDSSVAITVAAHTSLGTMPIYLYGSEAQKQEWLPRLASGRSARRLRADRARGRLGRRGHEDARRAARRQLDRERLEDVHHERGHRHQRLRHDRGAHRRRRDVEHPRPERRRRLRAVGAAARSSAGARPTRASSSSTTATCRRPTCSASAAAASSSSSRSSTAAASPSPRWASGSRRARMTWPSPTRRSGSSSAGRSRGSRRCSSRSPTWRPRSRPAAQLVHRAAWLKDEGKPFALAAAQAKLYTGLLSNRAVNAALQIHGGYGFMDESADLPPLPRPEDPRDRRGHERDPADGDREAPRARRLVLPVALAVVAALLFAQASLRLRRRGRADLAGWDRAALFGLGLALTLVALVAPLDRIADDSLLSAHMTQHVLIGDATPAAAHDRRGPRAAARLHAPRVRPRAARAQRARPRRAPLPAAAARRVRPVGGEPRRVARAVPLRPRAPPSGRCTTSSTSAGSSPGCSSGRCSSTPARTRGSPSAAGSRSPRRCSPPGQVLTDVLVFCFHPLYPAYHGAYGLSALTDQQLSGVAMMVEQLLTLGTLVTRAPAAAAAAGAPARHGVSATSFSFEPALSRPRGRGEQRSYYGAERHERPLGRRRRLVRGRADARSRPSLNSPLETIAAHRLLLVHLLQNGLIADIAPAAAPARAHAGDARGRSRAAAAARSRC